MREEEKSEEKSEKKEKRPGKAKREKGWTKDRMSAKMKNGKRFVFELKTKRAVQIGDSYV